MKSSKPNSYDLITDRMIQALENGTCPWRKPWSACGNAINAVSGKRYRGVNVFMLAFNDYADPRWLTYKQAQELGGNVKTGEKGTYIYFYKWVQKPDANDPSKVATYPLFQRFVVFNVSQCENLKLKPLEVKDDNEPLVKAEAIIEYMSNKPVVRFGGNRACYHPTTDVVCMPTLQSFDSSEEYYSTFFHELAHATGHSSRLNRKEITESKVTFGDCDYSKEELVAELTASMVCCTLGIDNNQSFENSASYLRNWLGVLKKDMKIFAEAAGKAQKAADFIMGVSFAQEQDSTEELAA